MANRPSSESTSSAMPGLPNRRLANLLLLTLIGAVLTALMSLVFQTIEAERAEREQVELTSDVLLELRALERASLNAETGQRGYFITLDRRYLAPYLEAQRQYRPTLERLRAAFGEKITSRQDALLREIDEQSRIKFAELGDSVEAIEAGRILDARRDILTDEGQRAMASLRTAISELEDIENAILQRSREETLRQERRLIPLLSALVLVLIGTIFFGYSLLRQTTEAQARAAQAEELEQARDRADLLAQELNHRVKNLFAVVLAIVQMTGRSDPNSASTVENISNRIRALLNAHDVTQGTAVDDAGSLQALIEATLAPYRSDELVAHLAGPDVAIVPEQATPLGLVLHEMTTNAVKYGAWATGGELSVTWRVENGDVIIDWDEDMPSGVNQPAREGFGSLLMKSSSRQLNGTIERHFTDKGVAIDIRFPSRPSPTS